jgi:hypothetical protein
MMPNWEFKVMQVGMSDAPDKFNSASRDGWEVVTAQFIPSGDAVGRIGIFALLKRGLASPNMQVG